MARTRKVVWHWLFKTLGMQFGHAVCVCLLGNVYKESLSHKTFQDITSVSSALMGVLCPLSPAMDTKRKGNTYRCNGPEDALKAKVRSKLYYSKAVIHNFKRIKTRLKVQV